jgi:CDP-glucose 4,6-dehydratase
MGLEFFRHKRVLVSGHTGFKGGWLCLWLQELGSRVHGYALPPPTTPSLFEVARVGDGMTSYEGDVRDLPRLLEVFEEVRPEIVFHLASQAIVRQSYEEPTETLAVNTLGTAHLLEAVRRTRYPRSVVVVTSDKCYENVERREGYREDEALGGRDPYSVSKACAELVTRCYRRSFLRDGGEPPVPVATARAGNVIGGGDWARDRLVPDLVRALLDGAPFQVRYPEAVRPWQFVLDPLAGYLALAERLWHDGQSFAEAWNFGPPEQEVLEVGRLVAAIRKRWGGEGVELEVEPAPGPHPHEHHLLLLDPTKAVSRLGWRPVQPLGETVKAIVDWYQAFGAGDDVRELSLRQIAAYERRLAWQGVPVPAPE